MKTPSMDDIGLFLAIAREGSLSGAARSLGLGAPAVSHRLKKLEREMGVTLFARTTRSVTLTEAGRTLFERANPAMELVADAVEEARGVGHSTVGALRLSLPWSAYKIVLAPVLGEFRRLYPDITLEMSFSEALVDIVREDVHAGMRLGDRLSPGMTAVRLTGDLSAAYSASPSYIERHGRPEDPADLMDHDCIRYRFVSARQVADWQFQKDGQPFVVNPPAALVFDSFQSVVQAACEGHGIGWSLRAVVADELASGQLEGLLDPYTIKHPPFFLYYPEQYKRLELLRVLIDFLVGRRT